MIEANQVSYVAAKTTERVPAVREGVQHLFNRLSRVEDMVAQLRYRLYPVLQQEPPVAQKSIEPKAGDNEQPRLADELAFATDRLQTLLAVTEDLLERLEV